MATLSALHPYVVPHFPNVPEPAIDRAILDGAIQFCRDSLAWQESTDPIYVIAGVAELDTRRAAAFARDAEAIGADGLMVLPAMVYVPTQAELAARARVSTRWLSMFENGKTPGAELSKVLGVLATL